MALEQVTVEKTQFEQNTGWVPEATKETAPAQIDEIERQAKAHVANAEVQTSRAVEEETKAKGAAQKTPELGVYTEIGLQASKAPGLQLGQMALETLADGGLHGKHDIKVNGTTLGDTRSAKDAIDIHDDVRSASRAPGVYRANPAVEKMGEGSAARRTEIAGNLKQLAGEDLVARASIAGDSINAKTGNGQPPGATATWDVPEKKLASATEAKKMTFELALANQQRLDGVHVARKEQEPIIAKIQEMSPRAMAPGMALGGMSMDLVMKPKGPTQSIFQEAPEDESWKGAQAQS